MGDGLKLSFLAKAKSMATPLATIDAVAAPGRTELAKVSVPDDRDMFELIVIAFRPGFAAEAPAVSEQILMEEGYEITGSRHTSLTSADAKGKTLDESKVAKHARSLCQTRGETVFCLFMQGNAEYATGFDEQASMLAQSLTFSGGSEQGFAANQIAHLDLALGDNGMLPLAFPSAFSVATNDFSGSLPGTLRLQQGSPDNPSSVILLSASTGKAPSSAEAIDSVADGIISGWLDENAALFASPVLASEGDLVGLKAGDLGRTYAYVVDKQVGGRQAQIRLSLFASNGVRYSVLMVTHYSQEVDETGPFIVRLGGVTGYDLVMESILSQLR
ncbi:hypothetical protein E2F50_22405 [Rhizobium deserti]|uniref:Uncharacterized protein n=1 Tax=Rhizobium deserti TaxID=2547961 RepID=A0A4R5U6B6_9HYPH|nr:hypothetical protein [Rhizobium deserti]TDK29595.1 hypothetical protein E2F50_22405 [Rhizobium deserti]